MKSRLPSFLYECRVDDSSTVGLNEFVILYGLHDRQIARIVEWYTSREVAEAELAVILANQPESVELLEVVLVDFDGAGVRVEQTSAPLQTPERR